MNKKTIIISIIVATLIALLPISSVIGTNSIESKENLKSASSPLFSVRSQRMINNEDTSITSNYLGKEKLLNLFSEKTTLNYNLERALRLIENNPLLLNLFLDKIKDEPMISNILSEYDITESEFQSYVNQIQNNRFILIDNLNIVKDNLPENTPLRLGFNDSNNSLGLLIVFIFVILPIVASLSLILATITIITCFNIGGCFEAIFLGLAYAFIQGLEQPI